MQLTELIAKMNNLSSDAEVACFYKSLRQDALSYLLTNQVYLVFTHHA